MICFGIEFSQFGIKFSKWINDNISKDSFIRLKEKDINYFNGLNNFLSNLNMKFKNIIHQEKNNSYEYTDSLNELGDYEFSDDFNEINDIDSEENWKNDKYNIHEKCYYIKENDYKNYGMNHIGYKREREKYDSDDSSDESL